MAAVPVGEIPAGCGLGCPCSGCSEAGALSEVNGVREDPNCLVVTEFTGALLADVSLSGVGAGVNSRSFIGVSVGVKVVGVEEGGWAGRRCSGEGGGVKGG